MLGFVPGSSFHRLQDIETTGSVLPPETLPVAGQINHSGAMARGLMVRILRSPARPQVSGHSSDACFCQLGGHNQRLVSPARSPPAAPTGAWPARTLPGGVASSTR